LSIPSYDDPNRPGRGRLWRGTSAGNLGAQSMTRR
jgi:hypothetical protein